MLWIIILLGYTWFFNLNLESNWKEETLIIQFVHCVCNTFGNLAPLRKSSSKKLIYRNFWVEFRKGKTCRLPQSVVKIATSLLVYILCAHCGKMKKKTPTKEIFRESNSLSSKFSSKYVIFTKFTVRVNFRDFHTSLIEFREINSHFWQKISWNQHFSRQSNLFAIYEVLTLTNKIFREINSKVISLSSKTLLSRNFCQKSGREIFSILHTVL